MLDKVLNEPDRDRRIPIVNVRNISGLKPIHTFINQIKSVLDLLPIPFKVLWLLLIVLHSEKPCVLEVHESDHLLVPVIHDKDPSKIIKVSLNKPSLSSAINAHSPQDLHLVVLLRHLGLDGLRNILHLVFISHNALLLNCIHLLVVHVSHRLSDVQSHVDVASRDLLGVDHIHLLQLRDEFIKLFDGLLILRRHHVCDFFEFVVEVGSSNVKMLISNLMENRVRVCQLKICVLILSYFLLLTNFLIWVHDSVRD